MPENFENIESAVETKKAKEESYQKNVEKQVETTRMRHGQFERRRYTRKAELAQLIAVWRQELAQDSEVLKDEELQKILRDVEAYAQMDVTATHYEKMNEKNRFDTYYFAAKAGVKKESRQVTELFQDLKNYIKKYEELDQNTEVEKTLEEQQVYAKRQMMAYNLEMFLEDQITGYLPPVPQGVYHLKAKDNLRPNYYAIEHLWDYRDRPLFPHDPSPSDVRQGAIGDCYMVSLLANAAKKNPDIIKETLRDNGDGTVTVRLFRRVPPKNFPPTDTKDDQFEPFYVTVDKTAPLVFGSHNSLWVAMIEKAVVASGLGVDRRRNDMYARPVPENIDEIYEKYKDMPEYLRPTKTECPWLYDEKNNFVKWQPKYEHIVGGLSQEFGENFLGPKYQGYAEELSNVRNEVANDTAYHYMLKLLEKSCSQEFVQKIKNVLDPLEDSKDKLLNAAEVVRAVRTKAIDFRTYEPKFKEKDANDKKVLEGLGKEDEKNGFRGFAETLGQELSNMLFEMNLSKKTPEQRLSLLEKQVTKVLAKKEFGDEEKNYADGLLREFAKDKQSVAEEILGGEYPASYLKKFEEIKQELEKGTLVGTSTPNAAKGDSKSNGGLNYQHAYNVLGVTEEEINGKTYKFFYVRNPHGTSRMPEYDFSSIPPRAKEVHHAKSEGIFKVELSHFMNCMDDVCYNGKVLDEKTSQKLNEERIEVIKGKRDLQYSKLFAILYKDLAKALKKENFKEKKVEDLTKAIKEMGGIPLDGSSDKQVYMPDFDKVGDKKNILKDILKNDKPHPETMRILKSGIKLLEMYEKNVADPVTSIGKDFIVTALPTTKSVYDFIDMKDQNKFLAGITMADGEGVQLLKLVKSVNPKRITSSQQFKEMLSKVEKYGDDFIKLKKEPTEKNLEAYMQSLKELGETSKAYLDFKTQQRTKDGKVIYKSGLEQERVNAARKMLEYSIEKGEKLEKTYVEMSLASKMYKKMFPEHEVKLQDYPINHMVQSKEFQDIIAGKNIQELKTVLKDDDKVKDMTTQLQTNRKSEPDTYIKEVHSEMNQVFNSNLSTEEEKINAAAKSVYTYMVFVNPTILENSTERVIRAQEKYILDYIKKDQGFQKFVNSIGTEYVEAEDKMGLMYGIRMSVQKSIEKEKNMSLVDWFKKQEKEMGYGVDLEALEKEVDNEYGMR